MTQTKPCPDRLLPPGVIHEIEGMPITTYEIPARDDVRGTVVLCHGTPWSAAVWAPVARVLARTHRVLLWDMPGYGASIGDPEGTDVSLPAQSRRLAHLLDAWDVQSPHLVAHDIGGAVALGAHLLLGRDAATLHLWDVVTLDPWGSDFFRLVAEHEDAYAQLPAPLHGALVRAYVRDATGTPLGESVVEMLAEPWSSTTGQRAFYRQIASLRPEHTRPIAESLGRVRCPVAIGWGRDDPWISVEQAGRLYRALPCAAEPSILDGVGHLSPLEATDAVAAAISARLGPA